MEETVIHRLMDDHDPAEEESLTLGVCLALAIGVLNACTYVTRGGVFASSQSGNLLKLGLDIAEGDFSRTGYFLFPVLMFGIGVIVAEHFRDIPNYENWRRIPLIIEIILITAASFLPPSWDQVANPTFGLACGLQSITFRHIRKIPVQTVFINGSYQNTLVHLIRYLHLDRREDLYRSCLYLVIVFSYFMGIVIGGLLCPLLDQMVSLVSAGILIFCCVVLQRRTRQHILLDGQQPPRTHE